MRMWKGGSSTQSVGAFRQCHAAFSTSPSWETTQTYFDRYHEVGDRRRSKGRGRGRGSKGVVNDQSFRHGPPRTQEATRTALQEQATPTLRFFPDWHPGSPLACLRVGEVCLPATRDGYRHGTQCPVVGMSLWIMEYLSPAGSTHDGVKKRATPVSSCRKTPNMPGVRVQTARGGHSSPPSPCLLGAGFHRTCPGTGCTAASADLHRQSGGVQL